MRLFIGLALDADACAALRGVVSTLPSTLTAQYVPPTLYHITLAYLGQREESRLPVLQPLLAETANAFAPLSLTADTVGWFGHGNSAILYASITPSAALSALNRTLRSQLEAIGEVFDPKPLVPHVTLARKAMLPDGFSPMAFPSLRLQVGALTLFHSTRVDGALCYLPVWQAPFARDIKEVYP